jgi:hypothetical protein
MFNAEETEYLAVRVADLSAGWANEQENEIKALELQRHHLEERLAHLTDAYIERLIDKELFEGRKQGLLLQRKDFDEKLALLRENQTHLADRMRKILGLAKSAYLLYRVATVEEKRALLETLTSDRYAEGKRLDIVLAEPFLTVANRTNIANSGPSRDIPRTIDRMLDALIVWLKANPMASFDTSSALLLEHNLSIGEKEDGRNFRADGAWRTQAPLSAA